jgi:hypothetical protein
MFWCRHHRHTNAGKTASAQVGNGCAGRRQWFCLLWALLLLPPFIGAVDLLGMTTHLRLLLFPPLVAIGYALFADPYGKHTSLRDSVLGPILGALLGVGAITWMPAGPVRVMIVTAVGILAMRLLRISLSPVLAVSLLTLLVGAEGITYLLSIAASSLALTVLFRLWRRFIYARTFGPTS